MYPIYQMDFCCAVQHALFQEIILCISYSAYVGMRDLSV